MVAIFVFTPTESKYLISKAIADSEKIRNALKTGIIAMHPCTTGYSLFNTITGRKNKGNVWVTGMIVKKGLCIEANTKVGKVDSKAGTGLGKSLADPGLYPHTMVLYKGEEVVGWTIYDLMKKMGPGDVYVKGVNAIDINHHVGVCIGSLAEGTIGKIIKARQEKGFEILCPVGYEKLIPVTIEEASSFVARPKEYAMGQRIGIRPVNGTVITEVNALYMLAGVKAVPICAGGVHGGEGSICIAVEGTDEQVQKAIEVSESVKGIELPEIFEPVCEECAHPTCYMAGIRKPWVKD